MPARPASPRPSPEPPAPGAPQRDSLAELEEAMLDEVRGLLGRSRARYASRPHLERQQLCLLALEREQIVAFAYREEAVAARLDALEVGAPIRSLLRQVLVWIWKDEELHAQYLSGLLLKRGGVASSLVVYGHALQGVLSGWVSATEHHRQARSAPFRTGAANVLVNVASALGRVPDALKPELHYQTFRHYCGLNIALEASAELAYHRLVELAETDEEREALARIRDDEARHTAAFRIIEGALTPDDRLVDGVSCERLVADLSEVSPWFVPATLRAGRAAERRRGRFGSGAVVAVRSGSIDAEKASVLRACLDAAGLAGLVPPGGSVAVRASFMLGYDRRDMSNVNDPELVEMLARYLRDHGAGDVAVLEAPTVYGNSFGNRSVEEVASYLGFGAGSYRIVDVAADLRPFHYERGFVQHAISATWVDADLRIVMPKLRTDPIEFAHSSLSTLEGSTGAIDETFYAGRSVDFRSATMMLLDVAPPDFAVLDSWAPVADGPFGVMGCRHPASVRHIYASADALALDEVILADLGVDDPRRAPIMRRAYHWFGLGPSRPEVDGDRPALHDELRGPHASPLLRGLGDVSYPVYMYLSRHGELFVPEMDTDAFPPAAQVGAGTRAVRWASQRAFGLRAAAR